LQSDIYSIGIVLIELLISVKTQMELCSVINSLKNGNVPETLKQHNWVSFKYIKLFIIYFLLNLNCVCFYLDTNGETIGTKGSH